MSTKRFHGMNFAAGDSHHFARLHVTDIVRANNIQRASFGGKNTAAIGQLAQHQRPHAKGITGTDQAVIAEGDDGECPLNPAQGIYKTVFQSEICTGGHQMNDNL